MISTVPFLSGHKEREKLEFNMAVRICDTCHSLSAKWDYANGKSHFLWPLWHYTADRTDFPLSEKISVLYNNTLFLYFTGSVTLQE